MQQKNKTNSSGMALVSTLLLLAMASVITLAAVQITQLTVLETETAAERTKMHFEIEGALNLLIFCLQHDISRNPDRTIASDPYSDPLADERWQADGIPHTLDVNGREYRAAIIDAGGYYAIDEDPFFENFEELWSSRFTRMAWDFDQRQQLKDLATALMDYCDSNDSSTVNGAEYDYYYKNKMPELPRNTPMQLLDELAYIPGTSVFLPSGPRGRYLDMQPISPPGLTECSYTPNLYSTPVRWLAAAAGLSEEEEKRLAEARELWEEEQKPYNEHLEPETMAALEKAAAIKESGLYLLQLQGPLLQLEAVIRIPEAGKMNFIEFYDLQRP